MKIRSGNLEAAAAAGPESLDDYGRTVAVRDMLLFMHEGSADGIFAGVLEVMDSEVVGGLREVFDRGSLSDDARTAPQVDFTEIEAQLEVHDIQNLAARLFADEFKANRLQSGFLSSIGPYICADLGEIVDNWKTRYQHEEGSEP